MTLEIPSSLRELREESRDVIDPDDPYLRFNEGCPSNTREGAPLKRPPIAIGGRTSRAVFRTKSI
jgi:hypothetical protein